MTEINDNRTVDFYRVFFKNRDETPLHLSVEGGRQLIDILTGENPPMFINLKDQVISRNAIAFVAPVYSLRSRL